MISFLKSLFTSRKKMIEDLKQENKKLQDKLVERQEHINKTNAYWKKKLHHVTRTGER